VPGKHGFYDEFMRVDAKFSLGFMNSNPCWRFGRPESFGSPGAGGSFGYADPRSRIGYAYVTNRKGTHLEGDPRDIALRKALDTIAPAGGTRLT
jgi:CubicO group peptidase (beta-lactamase class C family)